MNPAMQGPLIIGIDLGTSNCALSWARPEAGAAVVDFQIQQLQRPGQSGPLPLLPSFLYLPSVHEFTGSDVPSGPIAGEFARWQGSRAPGRLISSAKSWLCHGSVDRSAPILPWGAPAEVTRLSPVDASAAFLAHLARAWDAAHPEAPLAAQDIVLTVPASFDEVARTLTAEAARRNGLTRLHLIEEPQAAFYDFVRQQGASLRTLLADVRLVLVIDVGGGTTDLTLIQVSSDAETGEPLLSRIAVGEHLMLGGDNMDAALARLAEARLCSGGRRLSPAQWTQLVQACRTAKETLLSPEAPARQGISVAGEGSRLLGNTLSCELSREEVLALVLDGFFPPCAAEDAPRRAARSGLQELGLPYAQDPGITRHVSGFLLQHARAAFACSVPEEPLGVSVHGLPRPDAILLNGGVFNSPLLTDRLLSVLASWWPATPAPRLLPHLSLDLAVARGAVAQGLARRGFGLRIAGGAAHSLYVGLGLDARDGMDRALCVISRGDEEGCTHELRELPLALTLNRPVQFPLLVATDDRVDRAGTLVLCDEALQLISPLQTVLRHAGSQAATLPVTLRSSLTELGTLELHCVNASEPSESWRLEFDLRAVLAPASSAESLNPKAEVPSPRSAASDTKFSPGETTQDRPHFVSTNPLPQLLAAFGTKPAPLSPKELRQLSRSLEDTHGPREDWDLPFLRSHWAWLNEQAPSRRRSADHERAYFQLYGFFLRPGFGDDSDAWRCEQALLLLHEGVKFTSDPAVWNEFWVLFRRISGGLDEAAQLKIWNSLKPHLARRAPLRPPKHLPRPKGVPFEGLEEMVRLACSLEHLPVSEKELLGSWLIERLEAPGQVPGPWAWSLGRLAGRVPLYGSIHRVITPALASSWLQVLLSRQLSQEGAPFAATQIARLSGDRARDLDDDLRTRLATLLHSASVSERWIQMLRECVVLDATDAARALGDRLPLGLRLLPGV